MRASALAEWGRAERTWNFARANLQRKELAGDAVHDTIMLALEHLDDDHPQPLAWLYLTLKRRCWNLDRRDRMRARIEVCYEEAVAADRPIPSAHEVLIGLGNLKDDERTALVDKCLAGFTYQEIMERHGWSYTKVNRCLAEGRQKLREAVET